MHASGRPLPAGGLPAFEGGAVKRICDGNVGYALPRPQRFETDVRKLAFEDVKDERRAFQAMRDGDTLAEVFAPNGFLSDYVAAR